MMEKEKPDNVTCLTLFNSKHSKVLVKTSVQRYSVFKFPATNDVGKPAPVYFFFVKNTDM